MITFFVVVFAAIVFEYSNGFHDAANAIATLVATRAARPGPVVGAGMTVACSWPLRSRP